MENPEDRSQNTESHPKSQKTIEPQRTQRFYVFN